MNSVDMQNAVQQQICPRHAGPCASRVDRDDSVLEQTVGGVVSLFLRTMRVQLPLVSDKMDIMRNVVAALCERAGPKRPWEIELAGALAWVGLLLTPRGIVEKVGCGKPLTEEEWAQFRDYHQIGAEMVRQIPRLRTVGDHIASVGALRLEGESALSREAKLAQDILTIASDTAWLWQRVPFATLMSQVLDCVNEPLRSVSASVLAELEPAMNDAGEIIVRPCEILLPGDTILEDITNARGDVVLAQGFTLTPSMTQKLRALSKTTALSPQVRISRPTLDVARGIGNSGRAS